MKNKKATFITIVVLLVIFLPLTIVGFFINHGKSPKDDNPNHDLFYKGYLWFYNSNNELIGKYECNNELCELTKSTINDDEYGMNYYKNGTLTNIPVMEFHYAFITDGAVINLYDIQNEQIVTNYKAVKDYHMSLDGGNFIAQNSDDLWGVLSVGKNVSNTIPFEYDFIGIIVNGEVGNYLNTNRFVVLKDNNWYIIDNTNSAVSGYINAPIIDYSSDYIISKDSERFRIFSYADSEYFVDYEIKDYTRVDNYLGIITENKMYVYSSVNTTPIKEIDITESTDKITMQRVDEKINILMGDKILDTIEI